MLAADSVFNPSFIPGCYPHMQSRIQGTTYYDDVFMLNGDLYRIRETFKNSHFEHQRTQTTKTTTQTQKPPGNTLFEMDMYEISLPLLYDMFKVSYILG